MASRPRRKPTSGRTSGRKTGSTLFGVLLGLILGLGVAAVVAYFVTQVPMPFTDNASRTPAQTLLPDVRDAPDPNLGLAGNRSASPAPVARAPATTPATTPDTKPDTPSMASGHPPPLPPPPRAGSDDIAALLATLGNAQSAAGSGTVSATPVVPPRQTSTIYFLQAGAFRSENDAQSTRARVLMLGLPAQVQTAQLDGAPMYRVRVGPFRGMDEMNRSREQLSQAKIETHVVRP